MERRASEHNAIRVMVVGDSISHGREGDWTWRYRIWEWFACEGVDVCFVGPYKGTVPHQEPHPPRPPRLIGEPPDPPAPPGTDGGYAAGIDRDFLSNSNHFAVNGRQASQAKDLIAEQVAAHQPDLCLVELGYNDLGWRVCGPIETLASMKHLVDEARSAKPDLKFAIANIPHRTDVPGREDLPVDTDLYDLMLAEAIPYWNTPKSPIALVRFCENYSCGGTCSDAAYDGLHPNALGEYQLAQAFSRTLVSAFSLGRNPLEIPEHIPPRPLPTPTQFKAVAAPNGIVVTWDAVYGAYGYDLEHRLVGEEAWDISHIDCNRYDRQRLRKGQTLECRVRTSGGDTLKSPWSSISSAVANPETAPPPTNIVTHATATGFTISWDTPPPPFAGEIDRYGILYFDGSQPGAFPCLVGARGNTAEIKGLALGHRYYITVETWTTVGGGGLPASARAVVVGGGTPPAPTPLRAEALGTRLDTRMVQLKWRRVSGAAGYDVWIRRAKAVGDRLGLPACPHRLTPESLVKPVRGRNSSRRRKLTTVIVVDHSVWDWEYAVSAYNGDDSTLSKWVTAPPLAQEQVCLTEGDSLHVYVRHG